MSYVDKLYDILKEESEGLDAVYENFIKDAIGRRGLQILIENRRLESCGVVNGRRLYVLVDNLPFGEKECNYGRHLQRSTFRSVL